MAVTLPALAIAVSDGRVKVTLGKYDYAVVVFE